MVLPNDYYLGYGLLTQPVNQNVYPHCQEATWPFWARNRELRQMLCLGESRAPEMEERSVSNLLTSKLLAFLKYLCF